MSTPWITALVALWLLMTTVAVGVLGLIRVVGAQARDAGSPLGEAPSGPRGGERPGPFLASALDGAPVTEAVTHRGRRTVLFTHVACPPCRRILDEIGDAGPGTLGEHLVVVVDDGRRVSVAQRRSGARFVVDRGGAMARAFRVDAAPTAVLVDGGTVTGATIPARLRDVLVLDADQPRGSTSRAAV